MTEQELMIVKRWLENESAYLEKALSKENPKAPYSQVFTDIFLNKRNVVQSLLAKVSSEMKQARS